VRLPSSPVDAFTTLFDPSLRSIVPAIVCEPFQGLQGRLAKRLEDLTKKKELETDPEQTMDESVDSFFTRRLGRAVAGDLVSAFIHGVYAGDSTSLSIQATFPSLCKLEKEYGSIVWGMLFRRADALETELVNKLKENFDDDVREMLEKTSVWGLRGGLETLTRTLRMALESMPNVEIIQNAPVFNITYQKDQSVRVRRLCLRSRGCPR
jgi:oxygen-dependent protoporphyrinogen oxidase